MRSWLAVAVAVLALGACGSIAPTGVPKSTPTPVLPPPLRLSGPRDKEPAPLALYLEGDSVKKSMDGWTYRDWILVAVIDPSVKVDDKWKGISLKGHVDTQQGVIYDFIFEEWCPDPEHPPQRHTICDVKLTRPFPVRDTTEFQSGSPGYIPLYAALHLAKRFQMTTRVAEAATPTQLVIETNFGTYTAPYNTDPHGFVLGSSLIRDPEPFANISSVLSIDVSPSVSITLDGYCDGVLRYTATNSDRLREGRASVLTGNSDMYIVNFLEPANWAYTVLQLSNDGSSIGPGQTKASSSSLDRRFGVRQSAGAGDYDPLFIAAVRRDNGTVRWFELPPRGDRCTAK